MRRLISTLYAAGALMAAPTAAYAGKAMFGVDEDIRKIQSLGQGADGQELYLGRLVSTRFFIAGLYVKDRGFVVGKGADRYLPLTPRLTSELQKTGVLPTPLPSFHLRWVDYVLGYSLWLLLAVILLWAFVGQPVWDWIVKRTPRVGA